MKSKKSDPNDIYGNLFEELREQWVNNLSNETINITDESFNRLPLDPKAKTTLCFFSVPDNLISAYRTHIFPIFKRYGLTPITSTDIISNNNNVIATTIWLIERSVIVIVDIGTSRLTSKFEIQLALEKKKNIIIIREGYSDTVNINDEKITTFERSSFLEGEQIMYFINQLENYLQRKSSSIIKDTEYEPLRFMNEKNYRFAVISSFILLEAELREKLKSTASLKNLLSLAKEVGYIENNMYESLLPYLAIRNKAVHSNQQIEQDQASNVVNKIREVLEYFRNEYKNKHRILNETDRTILGTRFYKTLCEKTQNEGKNTFSKIEIYNSSNIGAFNQNIVIPLIIHKLKSLNYIEEISDNISLTEQGKIHCGEEIILDEGI